MDIERKRREKQGLYDKQEIVDLFTSHLEEVEEFIIVCKYKGKETGFYTSTSEPVTALGLLEVGKVHALDGE